MTFEKLTSGWLANSRDKVVVPQRGAPTMQAKRCVGHFAEAGLTWF
ncbi:hypothetical protein LZ016_06655 [Sphingomonas sp. SM33]|uniref:Transposase n=1 Tax=Sphingomonas telluris TaxID=2907998 RepID=A0ABS9VLD3_9SPHN|nr:hypothetical protein [Sphingomonas telluris]MCH8615780.1 hypothetical protein [Sphingomonas telluris]